MNSLKDVELALPVFYQKVIKQVCDLAELEMRATDSDETSIHEVKNYYVLILQMAGMIDDFKAALDEMLRAANLPISIIVIKMGKN